MNHPLLGIDLGGTKIEVAALAPDDGRFLVRERVATPPGGYDALLATIAGLVDRTEARLGVRAWMSWSAMDSWATSCSRPARASPKGS